MFDTHTTDTSINHMLFLMASLSPKVQESLDKELYRLHTDSDQADDHFILEDAWQNLNRDLLEIGVTIDIDGTDYVEDMTLLSQFLEVASLLLPNSLYPLLKSDSGIRDTLRHILQGSLGEHESLLSVYLTELGGLDGTLALRPSLADYLDRIYLNTSQTAGFTDYIRHMFDLLDEEVITAHTDPQRHIQYAQFLKTYIGKTSEAVNLLALDPDYEPLLRIQNAFIRDLQKTDNFTPYAYMFLDKPEDLPEELRAGHAQKLYYYQVSHPWCYTYYTTRNLPIPRPYQLMIRCWTYAQFGGDPKTYTTLLNAFLYTYPDDLVSMTLAPLFQEV